MNKFDLFNVLVSSYCFDLIAVTESWSRAEIGESELAIPNYSMFRADRRNRRGGGTALYVRNCFEASSIENLNDNYDDIVGCRLKLKGNERLTVICAYRSDSNTPQQNNNLLASIRQCLSQSSQSLLVGDFNFREIDWSSFMWPAKCDAFMELVLDYSLSQHVLEATRQHNVLDLVFSTEEGMVSNVQIRAGLGISDHFSVFFDCHCFAKREEKSRLNLDWCRAKWDHIRLFLQFALKHLDEFKSANEMWAILRYAFEDCANLFVRKKPRSSKRRKPMWADNVAYRAIKVQQNAHRSFLRSRTGVSYNRYIAASHRATAEVKRSVAVFEQQLAANIKSDSKSFWS